MHQDIMNDNIAQTFLYEASGLETLVAELYMLFERSFPEDYDFWHQLALEEKNHATLIRAIQDNPNWSNQFVSSFAPDLLREVKEVKKWLSSVIAGFSEEKPDRKTAFHTALKVENSAGEIDYQNVMTQNSDSWILKGLQNINKYDRDHINRLKRYMEENKII